MCKQHEAEMHKELTRKIIKAKHSKYGSIVSQEFVNSEMNGKTVFSSFICKMLNLTRMAMCFPFKYDGVSRSQDGKPFNSWYNDSTKRDTRVKELPNKLRKLTNH